MKKTNHDMMTLAAPIELKDDFMNPNIVKIAMSPVSLHQCARAHYFSRSPIPYNATKAFHHIGIYGYKRSILKRFVSLTPSPLELDERLEQLRALEDGIMIHAVTVDQAPQSVDTPEDLEKVRACLQS
jgi:3-deoxy-manno-octulosonate cytidylyltransferase (CMP-KDO synthetase)